MTILTKYSAIGRWVAGATILIALAMACRDALVPLSAQAFVSGSDGSDGPLVLEGGETIVFDPRDARWGKVLDPDGDGVYNFTNILIGGGTTLRITTDKIVRPVYFLASGNVVIAGAIAIHGENGVAGPDFAIRRMLAPAGPGGFTGGSGGLAGATGVPPSPGDGPGGGAAAAIDCPNAIAGGKCGAGGKFTGNRYLIPLEGGSGGGGGLTANNNYYNAGAGGGAILLASSTSISISGAIYASGGNGASNIGGGGSGGAIRLVAPVLSGTGTLDVRGGSGIGGGGAGASGMVRLERFTQNGNFALTAGGFFSTVGSPVDPDTLRPQGLVRVSAIDGKPVPPTASGSFVLPDVTISSAVPVPVQIEARGIPPGTVVTLQVFPQSPDDPALINLPPVQTTLSGSLEKSTATINFSFPYGFSRGTLRATW